MAADEPLGRAVLLFVIAIAAAPRVRVAPGDGSGLLSDGAPKPAAVASPWSGHYVLTGSWGGMDLSVADGRVAYSFRTFEGGGMDCAVAARIRGHRLEPAKALTSPLAEPLSFKEETTTLDFVPWGERVYLVPEQRLADFAAAVASKREPRHGLNGDFLLRLGDEDKAVRGRPALPRFDQAGPRS